MRHGAITVAFVLAVASAVAFSQDSSTNTVSSQPATSPVAYVYVSSSPSAKHYEIKAYAAASTGKLTKVAGSPFSTGAEYAGFMALNGKWLFSTDGINIYSFSIASTGTLKQVNSINAQQYNGYTDGGPGSLFFDHTGATLYDLDVYGNLSANNTYQFFDVNQSSGALAYFAATSTASAAWNTPLSFTGNNLYAYGSNCLKGGQYIWGFSRSSTGTMTSLNISPAIPAAPEGGYCPYLSAADPTNNVAISLTPTDGYNSVGPSQIGVYVADSAGNLTTTSTSANMPKTMITEILDMSMAPSGKLLAVSGTNGLQVLHFNGSNPATTYTGLLTKDEIDQMFWDNSNHLYAISGSSGKLFVFTITPASHSEVSGSPYAITSPQNIIVLPKS